MQNDFHPDQRWISESEPELGLGSILRVTDRRLTVVFKASGEKREYARANAPLRRVRFRVGDTIKTRAHAPVAVESVAERDGLIFYCSNGQELSETELSDAISFSKPDERLLAGQLDPTEVFDLRVAALEYQHRRRKSEVRGFVGGRIEVPGIVAHARQQMTARLEHEIARIKELQKVNRAVRSEEIELLVEQQSALNEHLVSPHLRLDAIRLIQGVPRVNS